MRWLGSVIPREGGAWWFAGWMRVEIGADAGWGRKVIRLRLLRRQWWYAGVRYAKNGGSARCVRISPPSAYFNSHIPRPSQHLPEHTSHQQLPTTPSNSPQQLPIIIPTSSNEQPISPANSNSHIRNFVSSHSSSYTRSDSSLPTVPSPSPPAISLSIPILPYPPTQSTLLG
ncbi:hypothetical protein U1Q18_036965 [Sarracenia purpurea var. burkii]